MGLQTSVKELYRSRGYTTDLKILALGLCEESGEVAAAVLDRSPSYIAKPTRAKSDLEHELHDCLMYICAIANVLDIDLRLDQVIDNVN